MKCTCGGETRVKDSRTLPEGQWRRRDCIDCGSRITTLEQVCVTLKNTHRKDGSGFDVQVVAPEPVTVIEPQREKRKKTEPIHKPNFIQKAAPARKRIEDIKMAKELGLDNEEE